MHNDLLTQELAELLEEEGLESPVLLTGKCYTTVYRWIHHGIDGVRLEAVKDGVRWRTSKAAVARFRARLTGLTVTTPIATTGEMARQAAADARRLETIRNSRHLRKNT